MLNIWNSCKMQNVDQVIRLSSVRASNIWGELNTLSRICIFWRRISKYNGICQVLGPRSGIFPKMSLPSSEVLPFAVEHTGLWIIYCIDQKFRPRLKAKHLRDKLPVADNIPCQILVISVQICYFVIISCERPLINYYRFEQHLYPDLIVSSYFKHTLGGPPIPRESPFRTRHDLLAARSHQSARVSSPEPRGCTVFGVRIFSDRRTLTSRGCGIKI